MSNWNNTAWVEIFVAGDHKEKGVWTESRLDRVIANFKAGIWKPPAVLGHPETDAPVMGWVSELERDGRILKARFSDVQPALKSLVSEGRYPNRSAAFYTDPQGRGPVLRHVGFLGATPPHIKTLAPIRFAFADESYVAINFQERAMTPQEIRNAAEKQARADTAIFVEGSRRNGQSVNIGPSSGLYVDPEDIRLTNRANQIAKERGIDFCEAFAIAVREPASAHFDEVGPLSKEEVEELFGPSTKDPDNPAVKESAKKLQQVYKDGGFTVSYETCLHLVQLGMGLGK